MTAFRISFMTAWNSSNCRTRCSGVNRRLLTVSDKSTPKSRARAAAVPGLGSISQRSASVYSTLSIADSLTENQETRIESSVPDIRQHRGAHPEDRKLFADDQLTALRTATTELSWLLTHGYAIKG